MEKKDYKKEYKDLYMPKNTPSVIDVPEMIFIMVDGKGDPNTSKEYENAMNVLYGLSYTIKMSKMGSNSIKGYFDYVVPPLEGFWDGEEGYFDGLNIVNKDKFIWTSFIRQPEFVTEEVYNWALEQLKKKKPELDYKSVRYQIFEEGKCVQIMHHGPYDTESESVTKMNEFVLENGYVNDFSNGRRHHEIYLSDPRKTKPESLKTVIRHPIKKK
jgi:hypothetical protein